MWTGGDVVKTENRVTLGGGVVVSRAREVSTDSVLRLRGMT